MKKPAKEFFERRELSMVLVVLMSIYGLFFRDEIRSAGAIVGFLSFLGVGALGGFLLRWLRLRAIKRRPLESSPSLNQL